MRHISVEPRAEASEEMQCLTNGVASPAESEEPFGNQMLPSLSAAIVHPRPYRWFASSVPALPKPSAWPTAPHGRPGRSPRARPSGKGGQTPNYFLPRQFKPNRTALWEIIGGPYLLIWCFHGPHPNLDGACCSTLQAAGPAARGGSTGFATRLPPSASLPRNFLP